MPFTEEGIVPDIIMNPHSIPSRMTVAQLIECVASKAAAISGEFYDGTPFNNYDVQQLPEILDKLGYEPYGEETMYCGITGKKMTAKIFIGPTYYMRLKHMVRDKVHSRSNGPRHCHYGSIDVFLLTQNTDNFYIGDAKTICHMNEYKQIKKQLFGPTYVYAPLDNNLSLKTRYKNDYFFVGDVNDNFHYKNKEVGRFILNNHDRSFRVKF